MVKLRNIFHTLFHLVLWIILSIISYVNTNRAYYEGLRFSERIFTEFSVYILFFIIYLLSGILFDYITNFLSKNKYKDLVRPFRVIFIIITSIFSLWILWALAIVINWKGQM